MIPEQVGANLSPFTSGHRDMVGIVVAEVEEDVVIPVVKAQVAHPGEEDSSPLTQGTSSFIPTIPSTLTTESMPPAVKVRIVNQHQDTEFPFSCLDPQVELLPEIETLNLVRVTVPKETIGDRVSLAYHNWERITRDLEIFEMVIGCPIPFLSIPPTNKGWSPKFAKSEKKLVGQEVEKLLKKGAIKLVPESAIQFGGHLFLRPKKDGTQRPIFNLHPLNQYVQYRHFKMEGLPI